MFRRDLTGATRSGKKFIRDLDSSTEYNPPLGTSDNDKECSVMRTPLGLLQTVRQGITGIPHPSTPPPPSPPPHTPTPPPPPPLFNMVNAMKIPIFKGLGTEYPKQFWFVADVLRKS